MNGGNLIFKKKVKEMMNINLSVEMLCFAFVLFISGRVPDSW